MKINGENRGTKLLVLRVFRDCMCYCVSRKNKHNKTSAQVFTPPTERAKRAKNEHLCTTAQAGENMKWLTF